MDISQLEYKNIKKQIATIEAKGRGESASFLGWFLENVYRLDDVAADDALCDKPNDKGIDGIYVDDTAEEIHFFQSKLVQSNKKTIGDVQPKNLLGSLKQFETKSSINKILKGGAHPDLKSILTRLNIATLVDKGYTVKGIYVGNQDSDKNTEELLEHTDNLRIYDRQKIVDEYVDFDADEGVDGSFEFDASYVGCIEYHIDDDKTVYLLPVKATELVKLDGISDTSLFSQNVRLVLGNTAVNKSIRKSVSDSTEHQYFPLYHNGVTLLCESAELTDDKLKIENYVVVNGAQSISTFYSSKSKLTDDLRIFVKVISLRDDALARKITINSNNQNSIKPRDLRSNHDLMLRLKAEFRKIQSDYEFEIKRGEKFDVGQKVISNEEAGRLLLAFDLGEPYSCHQIYKVFDDKYTEIFGRPEVDAYRIIFCYEILVCIEDAVLDLTNTQMANYKLTRYLLVNIVGEILRKFDTTKSILANKAKLSIGANRTAILELLPELLSDLIVDFNYEVDEEPDSFDYKKEFKSPERVKSWRDRLIKSFEKEVKKGKTVDFSTIEVK